MRPAEEEETEPEAAATDSRNPLSWRISVFSLFMLLLTADEYLSEGDTINLSLISEVLYFILMPQVSFFLHILRQASNVSIKICIGTALYTLVLVVWCLFLC